MVIVGRGGSVHRGGYLELTSAVNWRPSRTDADVAGGFFEVARMFSLLLAISSVEARVMVALGSRRRV